MAATMEKAKDAKEKDSAFLREEDLVRAIIRTRNTTGKGKTHKRSNIIAEFDVSAGRADLVFFQLKKDWRRRARYAQLPSRWIYALKVLPYRKKFAPEEFCSLCGVSKSTAILVLRRYEGLGYCRRTTDGKAWLKVRQPAPVVSRIIAIEAKLTDWKRALSQAYSYQRYANQSWVTLDASRAAKAILGQNEFRRLNVGLKVVDTRGHTKTYFTPRFHSPRSPLHFWEANGLIAASLSLPRGTDLKHS
jgi:hypothetical protein